MGGSNFLNPDIGSEWGIYGQQGIPAPGNIPASREAAATWTDSSGNFWLFGGSEPDGSGGANALNDLWKFNPSTKQWAWMSGLSTTMITCTDYAAWTGLFGGSFCGQLSVNGTLGVPAPGNMPGGRAPAAQWIDSNGNLWLFGGMGLDHAGELIGGLGVVDTVGSFIGPINDLWYYNPSTNLWTWMGGNTSTSGCIFDGLEGVHCGGQPGNYGTLQTPAGGNLPGTRSSAVSWTDKSGNLWLFSGWGQGNSFFSNVETYPMNDVWEYQPSTATLPATPTPVFGTTAGTYDSGGPVTIFDAMPNASIYYTTDGTTPSTASTLYSGPVTISSSETIEAIATAPGYSNSGAASATYVITPPAATPVFSVPAGTYSTPQTVTITDATPGATIEYSTNGGTTMVQYTAPIVVSSSETLEAIATATGYSNSAVASAAYVIAPPAATPVFSVPAGNYTTPQTVTITDATPGATIEYSTNGGTTMVQYTAPILVSSSETLEAIATAPGYSNSAVASAKYVITPPAATPVFSVPAGTYAAPQTVTITDATPGATIEYSANGGTTMVQYTAPIVVSSSETLEAIATASGYSNSATATAAYTINNAVPVISGLSPAFTSAGGSGFTLTVTGSGFTAGSMVYWGTSPLTTTYGSATQLTAQVPAADIATGGNTAGITVQTPSPGGGTSNSFQFEVDSVSGTTTGPTFTSTTATVSAGSSASFPVTLPSSVESVSVTCLNLPAGAACSYSATTNTLMITTSSTTPKGTYQITAVFTETVSGAASAWILLPVLLLPLMFLRRKLAIRGVWIRAGLVLVLLAAAAYTLGCGGGGGGTTITPPPQTH